MTDKLPPHSIEAEINVLGSALIDDDAMHDIVRILPDSEPFYRADHQDLYSAILAVYHKGLPVNSVFVGEELDRRGGRRELDLLMGEAVAAVPHSGDGAYYAGVVREKATARALVDASDEIRRSVYSGLLTSDELVNEATGLVFAVADRGTLSSVHRIGECLPELKSDIDRRRDGEITGVTTGLRDLDALTGGFQPQDLIIIAARPSIGKTAIALNIADHVALTFRGPVLFVSLEMGRKALAERAACARSGVDSSKLRNGIRLNGPDAERFARALLDLDEAPLYIDDTACQGVLQIIATARGLRLRHKIEAVFIDYIQLVDAENARDSRQEQVAKVSRRLKALARDLNIPVIAMSQLNRESERREDHRPRLSDLRESGALEQDADKVILLHRPDYYDPNDSPGMAEAIVAKNRNGACNTVQLVFRKECTRFDSYSAAEARCDAAF